MSLRSCGLAVYRHPRISFSARRTVFLQAFLKGTAAPRWEKPPIPPPVIDPHVARYPAPRSAIFDRVFRTAMWQKLRRVEWRRMILGDSYLPYNAKRIQTLKDKDAVPNSSVIVYSSRYEGYLRWASIVSTAFVIAAPLLLYRWWQRDFRVLSKEEATAYLERSIYIKFDYFWQYGVALGFCAAIAGAITFLRRRFMVRVYYDSPSDSFIFLHLRPLGGLRQTHVKAGNAEEIPSAQTNRRSSWIGNLRLFDNDGRQIKRIILQHESVILPWYYNHLVGHNQKSTQPGAHPLLQEIYDLSKQKPNDISEEQMNAALSKLNAQKMESVRQLDS